MPSFVRSVAVNYDCLFMKTHWNIFIIPLVAVLCFGYGCKSNEEDIIIKNIQHFDLSISDIEESTAIVTITHDGSNRSAYYGICVMGNEETSLDSLQSFLFQNEGEKLSANALFQRKRIINLWGLIPKTDYTYIVFSVDENGMFEGVTTMLSFTTAISNLEFYEEPSWKIIWHGEAFWKYTYWTKYTHEILSDTAQVPYYSALISDSDFLAMEGDISRIAYWVLDNYRNSLDDPFSDFLSSKLVARVPTDRYAQRSPGNYYAISLEVTNKGKPTGRYVLSNLHHIDEYTALESYSALLGIWSLKDADGKTSTLFITKDIVNSSVKISGWAGTNWEIIMNFSPGKYSYFYLQSQLIAKDILFENGEYGNVSFLGWVEVNEKIYPVTSGHLGIVEMLSSNCFSLSVSSKSKCGLYFRNSFEDGTTSIYTGSFFTFPMELVKKIP